LLLQSFTTKSGRHVAYFSNASPLARSSATAATSRFMPSAIIFPLRFCSSNEFQVRNMHHDCFWRIPAVERSPKNDSRRVRYRGYRDHPRTRDIRK
jgi:hypothetical protein